MEKIDYKKEYKQLYKASAKKIELVEVPALGYLMIHGEGNPNTSTDYKNAIEALFSLSYAIKFHIKKELELVDYGVMPLESQWWTDDIKDFSIDNKDIWKWTASIMQPDIVTNEIFEFCKEEVQQKKDLPALQNIEFGCIDDGLSAQILHVGPYSAEAPTIDKLHSFIEEQGLSFNGKHHEIYLNDSRRTAEEKLKTIIRQPVKK